MADQGCKASSWIVAFGFNCIVIFIPLFFIYAFPPLVLAADHPSDTRWYFGADLMFLTRTTADSKTVVTDANSTPGLPVDDFELLNVDDLDFSMTPTVQLRLGYQLNDQTAMELAYFGFNQLNWDSSSVITGSNSLDVPFDNDYTNDFDGADRVQVDYDSDFNHNFEATVRYHVNDWSFLLAGLRYMEIAEEFNINADDAGDVSDYNIRTRNSLFGAQFGGGMVFTMAENIFLNLETKLGGYVNKARQKTFLADNNNTTLMRDYDTSSDKFAWSGEADISLSADLPSGWIFNIGYRALWVNHLALAPGQLDFTTGPDSGSRLDTDDDILYHGAIIQLAYHF